MKIKFVENRLATLFIIAFGKPKPLHTLIVDHWKKQDSANFVLITDCEKDWYDLIGVNSNIHLINILIKDYYSQFLSILNCKNLEFLHKTLGYSLYLNPIEGGPTGWGACALRPLLPSIYEIDSEWWGWIDYDIFFDKLLFTQHLLNKHIDAFYYTLSGIPPWEQFKIFRTTLVPKIVNLYQKLIVDTACTRFCKLLNNERLKYIPMDAKICTKLYEESDIRFDNFDTFKSIAIHWSMSNDSDWPGPDIKTDVILDNNNTSVSTDRNILFFVADSEAKTFSQYKVDRILDNLAKNGKYTFRFLDQYDDQISK